MPTHLGLAITTALIAIAVILTGAPDWVVAALLGVFALFAFLALGDQVGEGE